MIRFSGRAKLLLLAMLLIALIVTFLNPLIGYRAYSNVRNEAVHPSNKLELRTAFNQKTISSFPGDRSIFIGIAASGGGSRAAVYTAAVMEELETLGFMKQVRAISSVSGAGLPSAYYALHGLELTREHPEAWQTFHDKMAFDFRSTLVSKSLNPVNLALTAVTTMDRTDLLADIFDTTIYDNASFNALMKAPVGPRLPMWFANATNITAGGQRFVFSNDSFKNLHSDLSALKISRAVATSAAFPGLLNTVTLAKFSRDETKTPSYIGLIDGGASDNLGTDTLLDLAYMHAYAYPDRRVDEEQPVRPFACFLFVVDAFVPVQNEKLVKQSEARKAVISHVIDLNFIDAFDALLGHRRRSQLDQFGLAVVQPLPPFEAGWPSSSQSTWLRSSRNFFTTPGQASVEYGYARITNLLIPNFSREGQKPLRERLQTASATEIGDDKLSCVMWHLPLTGIRSLMKTADTDEKTRDGMRWSPNEPVQQYRRATWQVTSHIATDFNLPNTQQCPKSEVQRAIRESARIAVREDPEALASACRWFKGVFPKEAFACDAMPSTQYLGNAPGKNNAPACQNGITKE